MMKKPVYWLFYLAGVIVALATTLYQRSPGYMDAAYYTVTGAQLASGRGLVEPFLWNYLDNPVGLPHTAFTYWMPMPAFLAAIGFFIAHSNSFIFARVPFILLAGLIPVLTARLAYEMSGKNEISTLAGWLAVFPVFYTPYLAIPDSFIPLMVCGGVISLYLWKVFATDKTISLWEWVVVGLCCGVINLCRADGLLWIVAIALASSIWLIKQRRLHSRQVIFSLLGLVIGFLMMMGWWYIRNLHLFGQFFAPASQYSLWFTSYDQLFNHPVGSINPQSWWTSGVTAILTARWTALKMNLATTLGVHFCVVLLPLFMVGIRKAKNRMFNWFFLSMYALLFMIMTVAFPFAGSRGGFFHSMAVIQPWIWVMAAIGFKKTIEWISPHRKWDPQRAYRGFGIILVGILAFAALGVYTVQVYGIAQSSTEPSDVSSSARAWDEDYETYLTINSYLVEQGMTEDEIVMVNDPPLYFWASAQQSIVIPNGTIDAIAETAHQYRARYLVVESEHIPALDTMYAGMETNSEWFEYVGNVDGNQIYRIYP
ncbi:MAG TPA: hypothetical protein VN376_04230 [Longilinea sp.]|nr:hypothetical protein [Longilinea sp.]